MRYPVLRSAWVGIGFLGLAGFFALLTALFVVTDYGLADLSPFTDDSEQARVDGDGPGVPAGAATPEPTPQSTPVPETISGDVELSARSAIVVHPGTDTVLFEHAADEPLQPASTAKIFTALTVLRHASPEEVVEIVESDVVDPVVESSMGLQAGDQVTVHDLLVGLLLPSGNDAANALARVVGERVEVDQPGLSPQERFVREMNAVARDLGLTSMNLLHPAGHDREGQVVTARELAVATAALLDRPSMGPIVNMPQAEVQIGGPNPRVITIENTNELLVHDSVFGVKTGTTEQAGECLVVASREVEGAVISVILGSQDRYGDARALLGLPEPPEPEDDPNVDDPEDTPAGEG